MKLNPCPFCGGKNLYMDNMTGKFEYHFVVCGDCWAEGPTCGTSGQTQSSAVQLAKEAWNGHIKLRQGRQ